MDSNKRLNFDQICRICMKLEYEMLSLFDKIDDSYSLHEKVMFCSNIQVDKDDRLPNKICKFCTNNLNTAWEFKKLGEETDKSLRKHLETMDYNSDGSDSFDDGINLISEESNQSIEIKTQKRQCQSKSRKASHKKSDPGFEEKANKLETQQAGSSILSSDNNVADKSVQDSKTYEEQLNDQKEETDIYLKVMLDGFNGYPCHICGKAFDTKHSLNAHIKRHEDSRPYKCEICNRAFRESTTLKVHMRIHTGEKPFSCDFCPMTFVQNSSRKSHMRQHSQETPYQCDICGKLFKVRNTYHHHIAVHKNERNFVCGTCGARFNFKNALRKHSLTHKDERNCICTVCHKGFRRPENLRSHMRIHSDEMPFTCQLCLKSFRYNCVLKAHLKSKHALIVGQPDANSEFAQ